MQLNDYKQKYLEYGNNQREKIKQFVRQEVNTIDKTSKDMARMFENLDIDLEKGPDGRFRQKPKNKDQEALLQ